MKPTIFINVTPIPLAYACSDFSSRSAYYWKRLGLLLITDGSPFDKSTPAPENFGPDSCPYPHTERDYSPFIQNRAGSKNFSSIVVQYNESLHSFVYHILQDMAATEDVVQDTFLALWINRDKIDFSLPLRNFLYVTARNFAYRHLRTKKRFDNDMPVILTEEQISVYMIQEEALRILKESIERLPARTAEVIRLSLEGMSQEKIAEQMGVGIANVKRLKTLGITKLKEIMGPLFSLVVCLLQ